MKIPKTLWIVLSASVVNVWWHPKTGATKMLCKGQQKNKMAISMASKCLWCVLEWTSNEESTKNGFTTLLLPLTGLDFFSLVCFDRAMVFRQYWDFLETKKREKLKMRYHWSRQPPIKESLWHFTNTTSNIDDIGDNLLRQVMLCAPLPAHGLKRKTFADISLMWRFFFVKMTANSEVGWLSARGYGSFFFSGKIPK